MSLASRRRAPRKRMRRPVRYGVHELDHRGYTMDLSSSGIAIKTNLVFPPGTEVLLRVDMDGEIFTARGRVRWARQVPPSLVAHTRCEMGIEFTALSVRFHKFLETMGPLV